MTTITHDELEELAEDYRKRLEEQGQLKEGMPPFSKYDFIAGVFAGMRFVVGGKMKYDAPQSQTP